VDKLYRIISANFATKVMAVVLATLTWVLMYVRNVRTEHDIDCPVRIDLPENVALLEVEGLAMRPFGGYRSYYLTADFRGSDVALAGLDETIEAHFTVEQNIQEKMSFPVPSSGLSFQVGRNIDVSRIRPSSFSITVDRIVEKRLEVEVEQDGQPAPGYIVESVAVTPDEVTIRGADSLIGELDKISTRPVNVSGREESFEEKGVSIADSVDGGEITSREIVTVTVAIVQENLEVERPVSFYLVVPPGFEYAAEPDRQYQQVLLKMPPQMAADPDKVRVRGLLYLDTIDDPERAETHVVYVELDLPDGVVYEGDPITVYVKLTKIEEPAE